LPFSASRARGALRLLFLLLATAAALQTGKQLNTTQGHDSDTSCVVRKALNAAVHRRADTSWAHST
jgi:hypothetical protein